MKDRNLTIEVNMLLDLRREIKNLQDEERRATAEVTRRMVDLNLASYETASATAELSVRQNIIIDSKLFTEVAEKHGVGKEAMFQAMTVSVEAARKLLLPEALAPISTPKATPVLRVSGK